jgi:PKD repeat protein
MHETLPQADWYNFSSIWPSSGGISVFTVDRLFIFSDDLPVVAGFSAQPTSGTAPLSVRFTDSSSGAPTAWQWNFGDGNTTGSTTRDPVHLYTAPGTYTVTLRASNNNGGDLETKSGYIVVAQGVIPIDGYTNPPTDPDGDGLYEDLNANGRKDFNDVVVFFQKMEWIAASEPLAAFNFNGNTRIDFNDIVLLFGEL